MTSRAVCCGYNGIHPRRTAGNAGKPKAQDATGVRNGQRIYMTNELRGAGAQVSGLLGRDLWMELRPEPAFRLRAPAVRREVTMVAPRRTMTKGDERCCTPRLIRENLTSYFLSHAAPSCGGHAFTLSSTIHPQRPERGRLREMAPHRYVWESGAMATLQLNLCLPSLAPVVRRQYCLAPLLHHPKLTQINRDFQPAAAAKIFFFN